MSRLKREVLLIFPTVRVKFRTATTLDGSKQIKRGKYYAKRVMTDEPFADRLSKEEVEYMLQSIPKLNLLRLS